MSISNGDGRLLSKTEKEVYLTLLKMLFGIGGANHHDSNDHISDDQRNARYLFEMDGIQFFHSIGIVFIILKKDGTLLS